MKARTVILLLLSSIVIVVGASFLKIKHVANADYILMFAMFFQVAVFCYIAYKSFSKGGKP
jgi:hypothetical protein